MDTFLSVYSYDSKNLFLADLHGSMDGLSHGGGVLVDGHHADFAIVLQQGHVAAILLGFLGLTLS